MVQKERQYGLEYEQEEKLWNQQASLCFDLIKMTYNIIDFKTKQTNGETETNPNLTQFQSHQNQNQSQSVHHAGCDWKERHKL
jgi:hypothetical protein